MRAHEFTSHLVILEDKLRKNIGNTNTGLVKFEYNYDPISKVYSGKFSIAYVNLTMSKFYNIKEGRILGIDNYNDHGKIEVHCHLLGKYLSIPSLNHLTYPDVITTFYKLVHVITLRYMREKNGKIDFE